MLDALSVAAFAAMVGGLVGLYYWGALFAWHPLVIAVQVAAFALMVAARMTFGRRSFHASANPTAGGLVTTGPYAYFRHPIYAAVIYFVWAGALDHLSWPVVACAGLITAGAFARMHIEETLLAGKYPEYGAYKSRVRRIVPFVY
jgi:protein-S-isoprenylcysteine O-methyltransferase Ste14